MTILENYTSAHPQAMSDEVVIDFLFTDDEPTRCKHPTLRFGSRMENGRIPIFLKKSDWPFNWIPAAELHVGGKYVND